MFIVLFCELPEQKHILGNDLCVRFNYFAGRSQQRLMLLFPERQGCIGCHEGIEEIRESGSIMLMQTKTLAKRSVVYTVALLATVAIQKD